MDKENTPLHRHSVTGVEPFSSEYDQHQKSYTLQLQTSVNVTLMPHEMNRSRQRMELSAGLEFSSFDSLSLSESEREKLRENSTFRHPVFDKTIDLMPHRMLGNVVRGCFSLNWNTDRSIICAIFIMTIPDRAREYGKRKCTTNIYNAWGYKLCGTGWKEF